MLIKGTKPWGMGTRCSPALPAPSPRPLRSRRGWELWRRSCCWWHLGRWGSASLSPTLWGWPDQQDPGGKFGMVGNHSHRAAQSPGPLQRHIPASFLPHCHAALIFLLENVFCHAELWVKVKLLTPRWGFRHQKGWSVPPLKSNTRQCGGAGQWQSWGCWVWASRALQKRHSSLLCVSHQHSQSSVSRTPLISTTATEENK